jgi:threonine/homoserine/homoserine lactone efflux protein
MPHIAALAGLFVAVGAVWLTGFALAASAASGFLRRPGVQRAVTGSALVGLGLRLAAQTRLQAAWTRRAAG